MSSRLSLPICGLALLLIRYAPAQEKKIEMAPVKYNGLKEEVLKHRGKVVIVDFWAGY